MSPEKPDKPTIRRVVDRASTIRRRIYQDDDRYRHFTEAALDEQVYSARMESFEQKIEKERSLLRAIRQDDARQIVARTQAEWDTLWRQHSPDRSQPRVDFSREMVVGVFLGSRPTAGFNIAIVGAETEPGGLVVRFQETRPSTGGVVAQVITSPYHLAAVPRQSGTVKFEKVQ